MPEATSQLAAALTGRISEYQEILELLDESHGLTVLAADPFSGTSELLRTAAGAADRPCVLVDARGCADALDLAMGIADGAVASLAPRAAAWWTGSAPPASREGLRLSRTLSSAGIDLEDLQLGGGRPLERLAEAADLLATLAGQPATLIVDHAGPLLQQGRAAEARELLGELRALRQRQPRLDLMLVEYPDGPAATALADDGHPLFRAGSTLRIRRGSPERFATDLLVTRPSTHVPAPLLRACADLAASVPALTWRTVELVEDGADDPPAAALGGWRALRRVTEPSTARQFEALRRVHPLAQTVVAVIASGLRPHAIAANAKSVTDALRVMRGLGLAWQPEPRRWALADPLLAAYARDHAPPWVARRRTETPMPLVDDP